MPPEDEPPPESRAARVRRELRALAAGGATQQELAIHLAAAGYDTQRAAALLDQLAADAEGAAGADSEPPAAPPDNVPGPALRVWAPFERARFSPEAWGQLLRLRTDGMGEAEFEHLVDRALLQLDGPVGTAELSSLLGDAAESAAPPTIH